MLNETLEVIANRKSTRAYSDRPITQEEKDAILQATFRAPTAGNMMLYTVLEIEDQAIKDRLAVTCDHQPFIARAPYVLLFLADYQRWYDYFQHCEVERRCQELGLKTRKPQEGDLLLACCDALIAAQTAVIAAESLGIGSCYIGDIMENYEIHRELLSLPEYVFPIAMVCFGRAHSEEKSRRFVSRFAPEFVLHKNTYHRLGEEELERMFAPMEERFKTALNPSDKAENAGQNMYMKKFVAEFSWEMSRSVREMLKNWSDPV